MPFAPVLSPMPAPSLPCGAAQAVLIDLMGVARIRARHSLQSYTIVIARRRSEATPTPTMGAHA